MAKNVLAFYPPVCSSGEMGDLFGRASWFFSRTRDVEVCFLLEGADLKLSCFEAPASQGDDLGKLRVELMFRSIFLPASQWKEALAEAAGVLVWRQDAVNQDVERVLKGKRVFRVDAEHVRMEGSFYIEANLWMQPEKDELIKRSREKFNGWRSRFSRYDKCYLLATGPSIHRFKYEDYRESLVIGCNSVFIDEEVMARTGMDILVFGDPIFHFGPSGYASDFRRRLVKAVRRYGFTIVVPFKYYPLLVDNYPELEPYTVGVPFSQAQDYNNNLLANFCLKTTANILTFLMVPVGATFCNRLHILGCDGRPMEEDSYFWGHNKATQLNDKMGNIREVHPGFFNIDYNDYYETHIEVLSGQLESCRRDGICVTNETFSHIPPLQAIHSHGLAGVAQAVRERLSPLMDKEFLFVSLNPDLRNEFGHYLHMDRKLMETVSGMGGGCLAFAGIDGELEGTDLDSWVCPILGGNSSDVNKLESPASIKLWFSQVVDPLRLAFRELNAFEGTKVVYMYAGHYVYLNFLMEALQELDCRDCRILVNLSGMYKFPEDEEACGHARRILGVSRKFRVAKGISLGADNDRMADFLKKEGELPVHVGMFPFTHLEMEGELGPAGSFGVYFPSNAQLAKGFGLLAPIFNQYIKRYPSVEVEFTVRCMIRNSGEEGRLRNEIRALSGLPGKITLYDHTMKPDEYARHYAQCSVVLIPYDPSVFAHRTSGQFLDALVAGKPVVCTRGTWAGDRVEELGCGLVFDFSKPGDAASAIERIRTDYDAWLAKVKEARRLWLANFSCDEFVRKCLSLPAGDLKGQGEGYEVQLRCFDRHHPVPEVVPLSREIALDMARVLVVDPIPLGHMSATGMVKQCFFSLFNEANVGGVALEGGKGAVLTGFGKRSGTPLDIGGGADLSDILECIRGERPDFLYIRPAGKPLDFFRLQVALCQPGLGFRTVLHVMDNWHVKAALEGCSDAAELEAGLLSMARNATVCLGISPSMCAKLGARVGRDFQWISNFLKDPLPSIPSPDRGEEGLRILYSGAVASETSLHTLVLFLESLSKVHDGGALRVVVQTSRTWLSQAKSTLGAFPFVEIVAYDPSYGSYLQGLSSYDLLLMAYNFDSVTSGYLQDSMANKLPEFLCSGVPVCVMGPEGLSTVSICRRLPGVAVCSTNEPKAVKEFVRGVLGALPRLKVDFVRYQPFFRGMYAEGIYKEAWGRIADRALQIVAGVWIGPFHRSLHAEFAEDRFLGQWLPKVHKRGVMLDVGAQEGSSFKAFLKAGWEVHAFEPDPTNRKNLVRKFGKSRRLTVNPEAVAGRSEGEVPFYASEESTGISSLVQFRDTHQEVARVKTVSLGDYMASKGLRRVDFLKVDVEGYDFFVLQGFPWELDKPRCIIAEFEDKKTSGLGHSWEDMAIFLRKHGYKVLVSEWHPIVRYGQPHDWRQLSLYPCSLSNPAAWGNLIAFRDKVDLRRFTAEVLQNLSFRWDTPLPIGEVARGEVIRLEPQSPMPSPPFKLAHFPKWAPANSTGDAPAFLAAYACALSSLGSLASGNFLFSFDPLPDFTGTLTGWCFCTNPGIGKVVKLRITWNGRVLAQADCSGTREGFASAAVLSPDTVNPGFAFSGWEAFSAPRQCLVEAQCESSGEKWMNVCNGSLETSSGMASFKPAPNYPPPSLAGMKLNQGLHVAYHFDQPSKRMKEYSKGKLQLKGWCFPVMDKPLDGIRIHLPGGVFDGEYHHFKPNVSKVFGPEPKFHRCGFSFFGLKVRRGSTAFSLEVRTSGEWHRLCEGRVIASWFSNKVRIHAH